MFVIKYQADSYKRSECNKPVSLVRVRLWAGKAGTKHGVFAAVLVAEIAMRMESVRTIAASAIFKVTWSTYRNNGHLRTDPGDS